MTEVLAANHWLKPEDKTLLDGLQVRLEANALLFGRRLDEDDMKQVFRVIVQSQIASGLAGSNVNWAIGDWINQAEEWFSTREALNWANAQYEESYPQFVDAIKARCDKAKIKWVDAEKLFNKLRIVKIEIPAGPGSTRSVYVTDFDTALSLYEITFEGLVFLGAYDAICNLSEGHIEAAVTCLQQFSNKEIFKRFNGHEYQDPPEEPGGLSNFASLLGMPRPVHAKPVLDLSDKLPLNLKKGGVWASFGGKSDEFSTLVFVLGSDAALPTLKIGSSPFSGYDDAVRLLEKVADSIFFEIDLARNLSFGLSRRRTAFGKKTLKEPVTLKAELTFPSSAYNREPLSLYWYAKSASRLPLVQYLAFYQCLEFYFPRYSHEEAKKKISRILKHPTFNVHNDTDLVRLLGAVSSGSGRAFGDEKAQLQATLDACVDAEGLREAISNSEGADFFKRTTTPSAHKINLADPHLNICHAVAFRIYDIRCKIVHTKVNEGEDAMLLPYSKEADELGHDLGLIEYVAQQVLVNSSQALNLPT